jgi:hypothetical protein
MGILFWKIKTENRKVGKEEDKKVYEVKFDAFTAINIKIMMFWNVTLCSVVGGFQCICQLAHATYSPQVPHHLPLQETLSA